VGIYIFRYSYVIMGVWGVWRSGGVSLHGRDEVNFLCQKIAHEVFDVGENSG